ncbi:MAG: CbtA family protein [Candidatus Nitrosotenuis sp.]
MKASLFIIIVLLSGCLAGTIHGLVNLVLVEPFLDRAIAIENENMFASGEAEDTPQFWIEYSAYRTWQKGGQILAGAILGTSVGALFGLIFAYAKNVLPGTSILKKSMFLAFLMWVTLYIIPFMKYPANPPTVGDPETIVLRQMLYVTFIAISGLGAFGFYHIYKRVNKKFVAFAGYAVFIAAVFVLLPANPDEITAPEDLVNSFRISSVIGVSIFWIAVGVILGGLWHKLQPDRVQQPRLN